MFGLIGQLRCVSWLPGPKKSVCISSVSAACPWNHQIRGVNTFLILRISTTMASVRLLNLGRRVTQHHPSILSLSPIRTTIPLSSRFATTSGTKGPGPDSRSSQPPEPTPLSGLQERAESHRQGDEEAKLRIEKEITRDLMKQYFTKEGIRYRVDEENTPKIYYRSAAGDEVVLPESHILLYRIERNTTLTPSAPTCGATKSSSAEGPRTKANPGAAADQNDTAIWKVHGLHLYVHAPDSTRIDEQMLTRKLYELAAELDDKGELGRKGMAFLILQMGTQISFFQYQNTSRG